MERTELREAFFTETRRDPYAHQMMHLASECWARGYEQALRDHGLNEARLRETHSDRVDKAIEHLTETQREAHVKALIAFAEMTRIGADYQRRC